MIAPEKARFFEIMDQQGLALTYDDVRMRTRSGQDAPLPEVLDITSRFSRNIELKVPLVSAAMDTVTESDMAIAMAKLGGIGVIHAAMPIERQYKEVRRVKKAANGLIEEPVCVQTSDSLQQVLDMRAEKRRDFWSFPVTDSDGKLAGIVTHDSFKFPESLSVSVASVMRPVDRLITAPAGTTLQEAYTIMRDAQINLLPLRGDDGSVRGMYLFSDASRNVREASQYNIDDKKRLRVAAAVSTGVDALERVEALSKYADAVVIDTADGDSYYSFETLKAIKAAYPELDVVVGNISDGASARELAEAGADGIKVGQGPGSICTTRRETGIGMPQVTAVYESFKAVIASKFSDVPICADGGIVDHGDIPIAFAAGAHSVMMGRRLAGTQEAPGEVVIRKDGSRVKIYRGMGSAAALASNQASRDRYGASGSVFLPEGVESYVPYEGEVSDVLELCVLALRKGMRYTKSPTLTYHRHNALLKRITGAGLKESHPHDVSIA